MTAPAGTTRTGAGIQNPSITGFRDRVYSYYRDHARSFPWRETTDPYRIMVSEIMLQQTQAERVAQKYGGFIARFPDFQALAGAELHSVLEAWQGLGYNRRAIALKETAKEVMKEHGGVLPGDVEGLVSLPGIGRYTAGAVLAFAHNLPVAFIETNIRRVFIHSFFSESERVRDSEILPLVEQTLDRENPRDWYYALMDYGAMLKTKLPNPNRKSAHYARQAPFEGSTRQVRGLILKLLVSCGPLSETELIERLDRDPSRVRSILLELEREGFVRSGTGTVSIR